jgi:hypothetical protein
VHGAEDLLAASSPGRVGRRGSRACLPTWSPDHVRKSIGISTKKRPPIIPAWIVPGLVTEGARSRNHKKTRRWCDTLPAHLLDRIQMYAERNPAERFVRVAVRHFADKTLNLMVLNYYGQPQYRDVSYAVQAIQKPIRLVFHTGGIYPEPLENLDEIQSAPLFVFGRTRSLRML